MRALRTLDGITPVRAIRNGAELFQCDFSILICLQKKLAMADQAPRMEDVLQGLNGMADMLLSAADFFERQLEEVPDHKRYAAAAEHPQDGSQLADAA